ncbi:MAG: redoxin domain-containing protein [Pseudomonadota bacterium]
MELDALEKSAVDIAALGASLVAISPQNPTDSAALKKEKKLSFPILQDPGNAVAAAYGIRHALPEALRAIYLKFGIDLPTFNGDDTWTLPMPARLVIDTGGIVRYAAVNADYTVRPEPEETLAALRAII